MGKADSERNTIKRHATTDAVLQGALSGNLFSQFIRYCPNAAAVFDLDMRCLACSEQYLLDFGVSEEQVLGKIHYDVFSELPSQYRASHEQALRGKVIQNDDCFIRPDGSISCCRWECRPWYDSAHKIGGIIFYSNVFTEQARLLQMAKNQVERDKKQLEAIISKMDSGIAAIDLHRNFVHFNNELARILGFADSSALPLNADFFERLFALFTYPERKPLPPEEWPLERLYRGEPMEKEKYILQRIDTGDEHIIEYFGTPICNTEGELELGLLMLTDITKRQHAEEELRRTKTFAEQEQKKWLTILEHVSNGVAVFDVSTRRIYANEIYEKTFALKKSKTGLANSSFLMKTYTLRRYPDKTPLAFEQWPALRVLAGEYLDEEIFFVQQPESGLDIIVRISGIPVSNAHGDVELAVLVSSDITEQIKREEQNKLMQVHMEQTQRLESLGVLAGGIAHDFNNLLMAILGHADIALMKLDNPSPVSANLENIKTASKRAAELCTQLLAYSGKGKIEEKKFSLTTLVREMAQMLTTSISKNAVLELRLQDPLPLTLGDPSQMRQIVMNFAINASDAIGECQRGTQNGIITISTGSMLCSRDFFTDDYVIKPTTPGAYVTLAVADNGIGMSKETITRIFEPFFTTKFTGRGLGLSAILGIIRAHAGGLLVSSHPGQGTLFQVFFPALPGEWAEDVEEMALQMEMRTRFSGTVLLIDDEEVVREVCSNQLEMLGFEVLLARDGREGCEIYQCKCAAIDLVILDLTMPHMGGEETFRALRQFDSQAKIVVASGYTKEDVATRFAGEIPSGYLRKPYTLKQICRVLSPLFTCKDEFEGEK